MTKREEVTKQVSVKYSEENSVLWEVSYQNLFTQVGGVGVNAYLSLIEKGRGWALINFSYLQDGRLFDVGANSRLGPYSNKYGNYCFWFLQESRRTFSVSDQCLYFNSCTAFFLCQGAYLLLCSITEVISLDGGVLENIFVQNS